MEEHNNKKFNFFLKGGETGVLLIHGITGTPSEMRYLGKALNKAGFTVYCNTLPRHCDTLDELRKVTWQETVEASVEDFKYLQSQCRRVFVGGLSMGALIAIHLAYKFSAEVPGIISLAPTLFYDGWSVHKGKIFMNLAWQIPFLRNAINIRESWPYGLKDDDLRENIERFYKDAQANKYSKKVLLFGSPFFPLACLYQHQLLTNLVKKELKAVKTPILILHAQKDDMVSIKNARYILDNIGSSDKSLVVLNESYHMITIDRDKDRVAEEIIKFLNRI